MDLQPWIDQLKQEVADLQIVEGAAEFAALEKQGFRPRRLPAAYVFAVSELASENTLINAVSQRVTVNVAIVYAVSNLSDATGSAAHSDGNTIRDLGLTALHGWQPDTDSNPVEFVRGALLQFADQVWWWQDEFKTAITVRTV